MLRRIQSVSLTQLTGDIIAENTAPVRELNISQLMAGLNNLGQPLSPKYSEDPWFKKPGAAQRYADWKKKRFPETPYDTPNLIVIGTFHNSIAVSRFGDSVRFDASATFAGAIATKYNNTPLGLNDKSLYLAWTDIVKSPLVRKVASITGAKII